MWFHSAACLSTRRVQISLSQLIAPLDGWGGFLAANWDDCEMRGSVGNPFVPQREAAQNVKGALRNASKEHCDH